MRLVLEGVAIDQGAFKARFDLELSGASAALYGPSGCGKTTLLETVAGLRPSVGRITLNGLVLQDSSRRLWIPPRERRIGYVPQDLALFPHLDVAGNLAFGLGQGPGPTLTEVADALDLSAHLNAGVDELSGGERRRVALGRALLARPSLLLLDEPSANLDGKLRRQVATLLKHLRGVFDVPFLLVSHDPAEIRGLCSQVALIEGGVCTSVRQARSLPVPVGSVRNRRPGSRVPSTEGSRPDPTPRIWAEALC